ncbi:MAG: sigma-70 family RNA polymerase sigma factor [Clostridiales bacterium]|nr:sigma-70 family RNA polymerase sigma factor [Clostridiales bacterium]
MIMKKIKSLYIKILKKLFFNKAECKLYYFTLGNSLPAPLPADEEASLLLSAQNGDESAKQALVEHNLRLVVYIAKKFDNSSVAMDDLISIGSIGLIKAVNSYKTDKNIKLATFASKCIENEILMFLRKAVKCKAEVSLDEPLNTDSDGNELQLTDVLGASDEDVYEACEQKMMSKELYKAISKLKANEQMIIELRFGLNDKNEKTQKEVADMLGISQSYISRLEKKIIKKLKKDIVQIG